MIQMSRFPLNTVPRAERNASVIEQARITELLDNPETLYNYSNSGNNLTQQNKSIGNSTYSRNYPPEPVTDHVYFDLTFFNNSESTDSTEQLIPAKVIQTLSADIVGMPKTWNLTIARFSISSDAIGRVYQPFPTTSANTDLFAGLSYQGTYYDSPIVLPVQTYPNGINIQVVYNVNDFVDLINAAWAASSASVISAGGPTGQPVMTFNPADGLYTINSPVGYGTGTIGTTGNGVGIHMSYDLWHKFQSFSEIVNDPILYNNHDATFIRICRGDNVTTLNYPSAGVTGLYYQLRQDAAWPSSIMDVSRLLITTSSLPVTQEFRSQQLYSQFLGNNGNARMAVLTDFFIGSDSELMNRNQHWLYTPNLYRIISLESTYPIRQIDLSILVQTNDGTVYPVYLSPRDNLDIKLLFLHKGLTS